MNQIDISENKLTLNDIFAAYAKENPNKLLYRFVKPTSINDENRKEEITVS